MNIPALDAIRSERYGFITGSNYTILAKLHDQNENGSLVGSFSDATPIWYKSDGAIVFESAMSPSEENCEEISYKLSEIFNRFHAWSSPNRENYGENTQLDSLDEHEMHCANQLYQVYFENQNHTHEILRLFENEGYKEFNTQPDLLKSGSDTSFTSADFSDQQYIPTDVESWGLYTYYSHPGSIATGLWLRFKTLSGSVREIPLVTYTGSDVNCVVDKDPSFGTAEDDSISDELATAIENECDSNVTLNEYEQILFDTIQDNYIPEKTSLFIQNATQSNVLTPE